MMFHQLTVGFKVHYVYPNGMHVEATVLHVHNRETGVVDLSVRRNVDMEDTYTAHAVVYRETPTAYAWHFIEQE